MSDLPTPDDAFSVPLVLSVELAGELAGLSRPGAYHAAKSGALPTLPGPGRKRVPTARLEQMLGRRITRGDVQAAEARLKPKREAFLRYQADYHAGRKANFKQSASGGRRPTQGNASDVHNPANHP